MKPYLPQQYPKFLTYTENGLFIKSSIIGLLREGEALNVPKKSEVKTYFRSGEISIKYHINTVTPSGGAILYYPDHDDVYVKIFDKQDFKDRHLKPSLKEKLGIGHFSEISGYKIHCYIYDSTDTLLGKATNLLTIDADLYAAIQDDLMSSMQ